MAHAPEASLQDLAARIDNLEMKITYQDHVIEDLNKVIVEQWGKFEQLQRHVDRLEQRLREAQESGGQPLQDDRPPPHY